MLFLRRVLVGDQERVLLIRNGRFERMLAPGTHVVSGFGAFELARRDLREVVFEGPWATLLAKTRPDVVAEFFTVVETNDSEVAVMSLDGKVTRAFGPGQRALVWRGPLAVSVEVFDANADPAVAARLIAPLERLGLASKILTAATVEDGKVGLLFLDGRLARTLEPGTHGFWNAGRNPRVEVVDLRVQTLEILGQEILTSDRVSIRVNVWAEFQVADAVAAKQNVANFSQHLHRTVQLAVRRTLSRRTLDEVLAERVDIDESVAAEVRREAETFGVRVGAMGLKDVILPGEMRDILNQVVTAEKQA